MSNRSVLFYLLIRYHRRGEVHPNILGENARPKHVLSLSSHLLSTKVYIIFDNLKLLCLSISCRTMSFIRTFYIFATSIKITVRE